jgi:hypothetical protein
VEQLVTCPCCGHVLNMHKPGGCYAQNLECACPFDRDGVLGVIDQPVATPERMRAAMLVAIANG